MESVADTDDPPPLVTRTIGQIVSDSESCVKGAKLVKKFHDKVEKVIILRVTDSTVSRIVSVEYTRKRGEVQAGDNKTHIDVYTNETDFTENIKIGQELDFENLKCCELDQENPSAVYQFLVDPADIKISDNDDDHVEPGTSHWVPVVEGTELEGAATLLAQMDEESVDGRRDICGEQSAAPAGEGDSERCQEQQEQQEQLIDVEPFIEKALGRKFSWRGKNLQIICLYKDREQYFGE